MSFAIGIINGKNAMNTGALMRSAYQMGAQEVFTVGYRYARQPSDTYNTTKNIPYREHPDIEHLLAWSGGRPLVAVETGGISLPEFAHPDDAVYLLGAEDNGIPTRVLSKCTVVVSIPAIRRESYNVAVAGSIVMYDRMVKRGVTT